MRFRQLGNSDLQVSEIALGSWLTYSGGLEAETTCGYTGPRSTLASRSSTPPTFIYGQGAAESAWGEILADHRRNLVCACDEGLGPTSGDPPDRGLSSAHIKQEVDASLRRLRVDHIDLSQAHRFDTSVPVEETIEALQKIVAQGKAGYLAFIEWTPEQIRAAIDIAGPDLFVSSQPQYSMQW